MSKGHHKVKVFTVISFLLNFCMITLAAARKIDGRKGRQLIMR